MIGRSSLSEPSSKRRRSGRQAPSQDAQDAHDAGLTTPKAKTKARARRAGRPTKAEIEAELERVRVELIDRDAEIERLREETVVQDTGRILELEEQITALRAKLQEQQHPAAQLEGEDEGENDSDVDDIDDLPSRTFYDWTLAAKDPFRDSYLEGQDDSGDITMTDVAFSTPSRRRKTADSAKPRSFSTSFPTPPCTSPALPATPFSVRKPTRTQTPSHVGVQTSLPDLEKESLKEKLASLHLELSRLKNTVEAQAGLQARLADKLSIAAPPAAAADSGEGQPLELEEHLNMVLQQLRERTVALADVNSSLTSLGFRGSDASEIIGSITTGLRIARLEIEYVTPGEITLPLTRHGAEVLNLVLDHIRELSRQAKENEEKIDEYHEIEFSLRQQLGDRINAMDAMREKQEADAHALRQRDNQIANLEHSLDRMKGAARGYANDIRELETWVECVESEGKLAKARMQIDLDAMKERLSERDAVIASLEEKLANTMELSDALQARVRDFQLRRDGENKARNRANGAVLAIKDKRILELKREINEINTSLRDAQESLIKVRRENVVLAERWDNAEDAAKSAKETVEVMKAELEKVAAAAAVAEKKRKHDSGVGLLEGDEAELVS